MTSTTLNTPHWSPKSPTSASEAGLNASYDSATRSENLSSGSSHDARRSHIANGSAEGASQLTRSIQGATSEGMQVPVDALTLAVQSINLPNCPEQFAHFIEETSLERLVYWKLKGLFEKFDEDTPDDILKLILSHVERPLFALVLRKTKGNQSRAAEMLGCNRNTLHRKLKGFAIQPRDLRRALKIKDRRPAVDAQTEISQSE
jgi:DNA-binding protein Fis